jgi:hypothetical protein
MVVMGDKMNYWAFLNVTEWSNQEHKSLRWTRHLGSDLRLAAATHKGLDLFGTSLLGLQGSFEIGIISDTGVYGTVQQPCLFVGQFPSLFSAHSPEGGFNANCSPT